MNNPAASDWRVETPTGGRDGYVGYYEGPHAASFYWEYGVGDVVVAIHIGQPSAWSRQYPGQLTGSMRF